VQLIGSALAHDADHPEVRNRWAGRLHEDTDSNM
jgi:hypothetical protein